MLIRTHVHRPRATPDQSNRKQPLNTSYPWRSSERLGEPSDCAPCAHMRVGCKSMRACARKLREAALPVLVRSGSGKMAVSLGTSSNNRLRRGFRTYIFLVSLPEGFQRPNRAPRGRPRGPPKRPKGPPRGALKAPKRPPWTPKAPQGTPKRRPQGAQEASLGAEAPQRSPKRPKGSRRGPREAPRGPQQRPQRPNTCQKEPQESFTRPERAPRGRPRGPTKSHKESRPHSTLAVMVICSVYRTPAGQQETEQRRGR